jgi:hypothetical protein
MIMGVNLRMTKTNSLSRYWIMEGKEEKAGSRDGLVEQEWEEEIASWWDNGR